MCLDRNGQIQNAWNPGANAGGGYGGTGYAGFGSPGYSLTGSPAMNAGGNAPSPGGSPPWNAPPGAPPPGAGNAGSNAPQWGANNPAFGGPSVPPPSDLGGNWAGGNSPGYGQELQPRMPGGSNAGGGNWAGGMSPGYSLTGGGFGSNAPRELMPGFVPWKTINPYHDSRSPLYGMPDPAWGPSGGAMTNTNPVGGPGGAYAPGGAGIHGGGYSLSGMKSPLEAGGEPGSTPVPGAPDPNGIVPPAAPGATGGGTTPGVAGASATATGGPPTGSVNWQNQIPYQSVPYLQWGGGPYASPFEHLGAQTLNARQIMGSGAGRFGNSLAARFGFANPGGYAQWGPDAYAPGTQIPGYGYNPRPPFSAPPWGTPPPSMYGPQPPYQPPTGPGPSTPPPSAMPGGGIDHATNFRQLMREDPGAAYYYTHQGGAQPWFFQNRNKLFGSEKELNDWTNKYGGAGPIGGALTPAQINRARTLAGMKPVESWRFGG